MHLVPKKIETYTRDQSAKCVQIEFCRLNQRFLSRGSIEMPKFPKNHTKKNLPQNPQLTHSSSRACLRCRSKSNRTLQKCPCPSLPRPPSRLARSRACPGTLHCTRVASTHIVYGANPGRFLIHRSGEQRWMPISFPSSSAPDVRPASPMRAFFRARRLTDAVIPNPLSFPTGPSAPPRPRGASRARVLTRPEPPRDRPCRRVIFYRVYVADTESDTRAMGASRRCVAG